MAQNSSRQVGRHFLQIPGPSPVPDRILRAMDTPIIDHRGPEFAKLAKRCLVGIKTIFKTTNPVIIYTATGTGAWEAALANTLSPGDRVLMVETGQFATLWKKMAEKLGVKPEFISTDWRQGIDPKTIEAKLREDKAKEIKAVCVLHNETSTGALTPIAEIRKAIDAAGHPALLMVDTISSLASADYRHDEWGVDVTVGGAQKGLMLPPGMSFNAISDKTQEANKTSKLPKSFFAWDEMLNMSKVGFFPSPPAATCCTRKGSTTYLRVTTVWPKRPAAPARPGVSRTSTRTRRSIRRQSPQSWCRKVMTPTSSAPPRWTCSTSPTAQALARMPASTSASAISASSMTAR